MLRGELDSSTILDEILNSAHVHSTFMKLKGWGDPTPTTALDA